MSGEGLAIAIYFGVAAVAFVALAITALVMGPEEFKPNPVIVGLCWPAIVLLVAYLLVYFLYEHIAESRQ